MASVPKSKPLSLIRSLLSSYVLTGVLLLLLSFLLYKMKLSKNQIHIGIYVIYVLSCLFGGFLAGKQTKTRRFMWGGLSGILYFAVLFLISMILHRGIQTGIPGILICFCLCAGCGTLGGMFS
ncbi:TIGR04086 family membrane protein [Lacrimispora sp. NSJ-141]|uniref:TIGR04086 family membrane protein n=1 Tax=Lientehia hominis TaxID=2897778 RepID=A0AAP2RIN7_9FIRM|nr:TIGR04086 family membrane protein [Lientehia hominis]MCD2492093.1 TIGR04086 family membrane protein [Lientehia hominis]